MSIEASKWAWEQRGLSPAEKLVLLCLADHADDEGENCWPSQERIARKTGVSRESVSRALRHFQAIKCADSGGQTRVGIVEIVKVAIPNMGALTFNKYKLLLSHVTLDHTGVTNRGGGNVTKSHSRVTTDQTPCDNLSDFPCDERSRNPSLREPPEDRTVSKSAGVFQDPISIKRDGQGEFISLGSLLGPDLALRYRRWRIEIGKPMGITGEEQVILQLAKLADQGRDIKAIVETNIANGWRSLRDPTGSTGPPGDDDAAEVQARIRAIADGG